MIVSHALRFVQTTLILRTKINDENKRFGAKIDESLKTELEALYADRLL